MVLCNIPLIQKMLTFIFRKTVRSVLPNFVPYYSHYISLIVNYCHRIKATPCCNYVFLKIKQLFFETFGRNFDLFRRKALDANLKFFSFSLCSWFFLGGIFLIFIFQRSFVYDIHKEQRGGRSRGCKVLSNLLMVVHGFGGRGFSFLDM